MSFYNYSIPTVSGEEFPLSSYKNKVVLVVNTATGCGFTPQYKDLETLYEAYHDSGLEIVDIPCNQFANQTPEDDEAIHEFCTLHYKTQFKQMKKSDVNGENALPLYAFLKEKQPFTGFGKSPKALAMAAMLKKIDKDYKKNPDIKWNFTKFLINRQGEVIARFEPTDSMKKVKEAIASLI